MVEHVNDRVKKHRASKKQTAQGLEEIRAANRKYAERARRKRTIKKLTEDRDDMKLLLNSIEECDLETSSIAIRDRLRAQLSKEKLLSEDKQRDIVIKVLKYEIKMMKSMTKGRAKKEQSSRDNHPDEPPKGRIDETSNAMIQMPVATQTPVLTPTAKFTQMPHIEPIPHIPLSSHLPVIPHMPLIPHMHLITQMPDINLVPFGTLDDEFFISLSEIFQPDPLFM